MQEDPAVEALVAQMGGSLYSSQCAQFPKADWLHQCASEDTVLGYWQWVLSEAEARDVPVEQLRPLVAGGDRPVDR